MAQQKAVQLRNFYQGGIADSKFVGLANSLEYLVGFDIHSELGILKVQQALAKDSASTIDDFVKAIVPCSDGSTYLFGSTNGKIWKRTAGGTYSLEATASPAAGNAGILDAREYQGYIYYAMQSRLGRWQLGTAWSTRDDSWATFTNTDANFHPMQEVNLVLYIGDANYIAQVDAGTFSANALDIKTPLRIKSLGRLVTDLLIGTYVNDNVNQTEILRWNTWSISFSSFDAIPEVGVNAFLDMDNYLVVNAGLKGNMYVYSNDALEQYRRLKGDWSQKSALINQNAVLNLNGTPYFGVSNNSGNPLLQGVYSLARYSRSYPLVFSLDFPISTGNFSNIEIGAIAGIGDGQMLISWKDTTSGTVYGIDKIDFSNKYTGAYLVSRVISIDRSELGRFGRIYANYKSLPANTDLEIYSSKNYASFSGTADVSKNNTKILSKVTDVDIPEAVTLQVKVKAVVNNNDAPELEGVEIYL